MAKKAVDAVSLDDKDATGPEPAVVEATPDTHPIAAIVPIDDTNTDGPILETVAEPADDPVSQDKRAANPKGFIGIDTFGSGGYEYLAYPHENVRTLTVNGVHHEHVATDGDGVWLYRAM